MIHAQNAKVATVQLGTLATNNTTVYYVDMKGYQAAQFVVSLPKASATNSSVTWATLAVQSGDATNSFTTISGGEGTSGTPGATQFQIPVNNDTSLFTDVVFNVKNETGKRYLGILSAPNSTNFNTHSIVCHRSRAAEGPVDNGGALESVTVNV